jgi:hypothetical protein
MLWAIGLSGCLTPSVRRLNINRTDIILISGMAVNDQLWRHIADVKGDRYERFGG